ncbi:MAG: ribosome-associated translation inhibitor RaiA [Thermoanaerobaculia bacterium]
MNIEFVGRHLQVEEKTRAFAAEKLERLLKFLSEPIDAHVVLEAGKFRHSAEIKVRCGTGEFLAKEETVELHDALALATEKVIEQAKRARKREVDEPRRKDRSQASAQHWPVDVLTRESVRQGESPIVVKSSQLQIDSMTINQAALKLESSRSEFVVFRDLENERVSVIYRRHDDDYGLIVPEV